MACETPVEEDGTMNEGLYESNIERDRTINEISNNVKLILTNLECINKCINDHESRLRIVEKVLAQHMVWLQILGGMLAGAILSTALARLLR
jgi:hypothetical protein